jgi:glycerol-1-phosphate dehydrogenase [NAD(P)+]
LGKKTLVFNINVISGYDLSLEELKYHMRSLKSEFAILIASPTSYEIIGKKIEESLPIKASIVIKGRATLRQAEEYTVGCRDSPGALIIGVGGGSVIDLSKYIAQQCSARLIILPTVLSSNAIASPFSVMELDDGRLTTLKTKTPDIILADFSILEQQPRRFILSGLGDLLAKYTSLTDYMYSSLIEKGTYDRVAVNLAEGLLKVAFDNAMLIASGGKDGIELLLHLLILDGYLMELTNTTRIVAGCEHMVAYGIEISAGKGLHGEQVAMGTLICSFLQNKDWIALRELFSKIGLPVKASQLGLSDEDITKALIVAPKARDWLTILGKNELKREIAIKILLELGIIQDNRH